MTIIQCTVCNEAWPYSNRSSKHNNEYVCCRCKLDKGFPKKFSQENGMTPSPVPKELQNLTQCEEMLIA